MLKRMEVLWRLVLGMIVLAVMFVPEATLASVWGNFSVPVPGAGTDIDAFVSGGSPVVRYVQLIITFLTGLIIAIGLIMLVVSGYVYMTAGGSSDKVAESKSILIAALTAIGVALLAFVILNTIGPQFASEVQEPRFAPPPAP